MGHFTAFLDNNGGQLSCTLVLHLLDWTLCTLFSQFMILGVFTFGIGITFRMPQETDPLTILLQTFIPT